MPSGAYPIVFAANYISLVTPSIDGKPPPMNGKRQWGHLEIFGDIWRHYGIASPAVPKNHVFDVKLKS